MTKQVVFFGSSPFSVVVLEKLLNAKRSTCLPAGMALNAVVTTPDKPAGRHLQPTPNPVKLLAQKNNILVIETFDELIKNLKLKIKNSVGLVAAYGHIIPQEILDKFNSQIYNIHPSLLPKYRGPSPLQQQILDDVAETGVTIIQLDTKMDHGPIVAQIKDTISPDDTWITLGNRLFAKGADLFLNTPPLLPPNLGGRTEMGSIPQNDSQATYTHKLTRASGFIPWEELSLALSTEHLALERKLRAFVGWPGVWSIDPDGQRVKLISLHPKPILLHSKS